MMEPLSDGGPVENSQIIGSALANGLVLFGEVGQV